MRRSPFVWASSIEPFNQRETSMSDTFPTQPFKYVSIKVWPPQAIRQWEACRQSGQDKNKACALQQSLRYSMTQKKEQYRSSSSHIRQLVSYLSGEELLVREQSREQDDKDSLSWIYPCKYRSCIWFHEHRNFPLQQQMHQTNLKFGRSRSEGSYKHDMRNILSSGKMSLSVQTC